MPLSNKWDNIELSDDEDFECHPNVDKASMVRWKQAEIYRERRERNDKITILRKEIDFNESVVRRLTDLPIPTDETEATIVTKLEGLKAQLEEENKQFDQSVLEMRWKERDARWRPPEPIDICEKRVPPQKHVESVIKAVQERNGANVHNTFEHALKQVLENIGKRRVDCEAEIKKEEDIKNKKITSENIYSEVYDKTTVGAPKKTTQKETVIETIHTPSTTASSAPSTTTPANTTAPTTKAHLEFAQLNTMEDSYKFLGLHPEIVSQNYSDLVLAEAFQHQMSGDTDKCRKAVQQALLLQYCALLGKDGVTMFFRRMETPGHQAKDMFFKDVQDTTLRIVERVKVLKQKELDEEAAEKRLGQERAKRALQPDGTYALPLSDPNNEEEKKRADIFAQLPKDFQYALLTQDVDDINAVLQNLDSEEGSKYVKLACEGGFIELQDEEETE